LCVSAEHKIAGQYTPITDSLAEQFENKHKNASIYYISFADYSESGQPKSQSGGTVAQKEADKYKHLSTEDSTDGWSYPAKSPEEAEDMLQSFYGTWYERDTGENFSFGKYDIAGHGYYVLRAEYMDDGLLVTISYSDKSEADARMYRYTISPDGMEDYSRAFYGLSIDGPSGIKEYYSIHPYEYDALMGGNESDYSQNVYQPTDVNSAPAQQLTTSDARDRTNRMLHDIVTKWCKENGTKAIHDWSDKKITDKGSVIITSTKVKYRYKSNNSAKIDGYVYVTITFDKYTGEVISTTVG